MDVVIYTGFESIMFSCTAVVTVCTHTDMDEQLLALPLLAWSITLKCAVIVGYLILIYEA